MIERGLMDCHPSEIERLYESTWQEEYAKPVQECWLFDWEDEREDN